MKIFNLYLQLLVFFFCSLSFLLPNHYFPWLTAYQEFSIFLTLLLVVILTLSKVNIFIDKTFFIIFIISFIPILQFIFGKIFFGGDAFIAFIYLFAFAVVYVVGLNLAREYKIEILLKYFSVVLIFCLVVSLYFILKQWLLLTNGGVWITDMPPDGRPFANFAQPNNCATFLCMGLIAILYFYEKKYIQWFCGFILASFIIFGIVLTQSRTTWVFTLFFLIWWFWKARYFQTRLYKFSVFHFVAIFIGFIILVPYISDYLGVINTADAVTRATSGYLRIPMWHQMLLAIKEQPFGGYGWNQVSVAQQTVFLDYPTSEQIDDSHNILLDLLIWNGIPLGFAIICFFSWWLYRLSKLVTSIEVFIALSMVGAVLIHAMLEFPLAYAFFLIPVGFLLGIVQAEDQNLSAIQVPRKFTGVVLVSASFLFIWIFVEYRIIEKDVELVRFESLNIGTLHSKHDAPNVILLTQLREQIRFIRTQPKVNITQDELNWMREVTYRFATPANLYRYAQALALNNQLDEAKKHLIIIEKLYGIKFSVQSLYVVNNSLTFKWNRDVIRTSSGGK